MMAAMPPDAMGGMDARYDGRDATNWMDADMICHQHDAWARHDGLPMQWAVWMPI